MQLKQFLSEYREEITLVLDEYFALKRSEVREVDESVVELALHFMDIAPRGKMVRGTLAMLGYKLMGGEEGEKMVRVSAGIEILEAGILIQDDFMDRDEMRRGVKTMHLRYKDKHLGNVMGVLAGDMAFGWALQMIYESGFEAEKLLRAVKRYNELFYETVYGQTLDIYTASRGSVTHEQIDKINDFKTARYTFSLPLSVGVILGGADQEMVDKIGEFAKLGGKVFQMRDDWLGVFGDSEITGKSVENDLREEKENIVAEVARGVMGDKFEEMRGRGEIKALVEKMRSMQVDKKVQEIIEKKIQESLEFLEGLDGEKEAKRLLGEMVEFVGRREK